MFRKNLPVFVPQAACGLWFPPDDAAPGGYVCPREAALAFGSEADCVEECVEAGWGWGYVSCLEQVIRLMIPSCR